MTFGTSVDEVGLGDNADRPLAYPVTLPGTLDDALVLDIIICLGHYCLRDHPGGLKIRLVLTKLGCFHLKNLSSEQLDQGIAFGTHATEADYVFSALWKKHQLDPERVGIPRRGNSYRTCLYAYRAWALGGSTEIMALVVL